MNEDPRIRAVGPKKKRRHPRKRGRCYPGDRTVRPNSHLEGIEASLRSAVREAYADLFGTLRDGARPFRLDLKVSIDPSGPWRVLADPPVAEQIRAAVREMGTQPEAFRAGSVYCYRCNRTDCPHSHPPRPTSVFGGYSSTGLPIWPEFTQILLERKHPQVDLLYRGAQTHLVAMYLEPEMLKQRQLNIFGRQSKTYDILGQVVFGFLRLRVPGAARSEPEPVACTLQAVESRRLDGSPRVALNVLARLSDGSPALDAIQGPYQTRIADVIASARHRIGTLRPPLRDRNPKGDATALPDTASLVADILQGLARKIEKVGRQGGRRTAHAEGHPRKDRPTSKAWQDALSASEEAILWDKQENTYVVLGPRNRVHVFSQEGRHVTSLVLARDAVRTRRQRRRWLPLTREQRDRFGSAAAGLLVSEASPSGGSHALSRREEAGRKPPSCLPPTSEA